MPRSRYHDRGFSTRRSKARSLMVNGARPGRHAEALLGAGVADVDAPVVGAELDPGDAGDGVDEQQGVALAGAERGDVGADAGRGLGVDRGDDRRATGGRRGPGRRRPAGPTRARRRRPRRRSGRPTSHIRWPKSPLTATTTTSPGCTVLTKAASMPAEPVALSGSVRALEVPQTVRSISQVSSMIRGTPGRGAPAAGSARARWPPGRGWTGRVRRGGARGSWSPDRNEVRRLTGSRPG